MKGTDIAWDYVLAQRLHKSVAEVAQMPNVEYETWQSYIQVEHVLADLHARTEANRAKLHG